MKNTIYTSLLLSSLLPGLGSAEVLSYSGRLVNATGVPVTGTPSLKFDVIYSGDRAEVTSGDLSKIICTKTISVPLANGVFHANLDFSDCGGKTLVDVISTIPPGQTLEYRVSDLTNSKIYNFQSVAAVPISVYSQMAKNLGDYGATDGQVLKWNTATKKWIPSTVSAGSGSLVDLQGGAGISVAAVDGDTYSVAITNGGVGTTQLADDSVTAAKIADGTITGVDIAATTIPYSKLNLADGSIPSAKVNGLDSSLSGKEPAITAGTTAQYWRGDKTWQNFEASARAALSGVSPINYNSSTGAIGLDTVPVSKGGTGLTSATVNSIVTTSSGGGYQFLNCSPGEVVVFQITGPQCGTISTLDATKLPLAGGTMSGAINMGGNQITNAADPSNAQDLATKNYVDTVASAGPWAVSGGDIYRLTGNVGIGVSSPSARLHVYAPTGEVGATVETGDGSVAASRFVNSVSSWKVGVGIAGIDGLVFREISPNGERMTILSGGNVGIGTTTPNGKLDVNGSIVMSGATSGYAGFQVPAVAGSTVWTLPTADGTSGQVLSTDGTGILNWITPSTAGITALTGDVTGTGPGSTATTISNNAVNSAKIADGTIVDADIAGNTISYSKLNLADGEIPAAKVNGLATDLAGREPVITAGSTAQYWRGDKSWQTLNTDAVVEATNLYFTVGRARLSLSGTAPINYDSSTGVIALDTVPVASGGTGLTTSTANAVMTTDATGAYKNTVCADGQILQFSSTLGVQCVALPSGVDNTKLPLAGGTMTGAIAMGTNRITGLGDPTAAQDAATKNYVDTADATKLNLAGGSMTGAIAMGTNAITGLADPTAAQDAATKNYVDTALAGAGVASDTDGLPEGSTNLYFTETRSRASLSGTTPINYDNTTGVIALDTVPVSKGGTGLTTTASNSIMTTDSTGAFSLLNCTPGRYVTFDPALGVICTDLPASADSSDKLPLAGGTMTGAILMGSNLISGLADPVAAQDAATKNYVDNALAGAGTPTTTDGLAEGTTNLYFTDLRARASLSGTAPINYNGSTGVIALDTVPVASGGTGLTTSTANAVMTTDASGAYQNTACADGEILQFSSTLGVQCATLPAGSTDKLPLAGGTMTGAIAMGGNAITGLSDPAAAQDAATKNYVDSVDATKLDLAGGTMTGVIDMGANKVTNLAAPTVDSDAATKLYVDTALAGAGTPSTTDDLTEGTTNLYFTDARARASLSGTSPIIYDDTTGVIDLDTVSVAKGGTGLTTSASNSVLSTDATGAYQHTNCADGEFIQFDTLLGVKCGTLPAGSTDKLPLAGGTMTGAIAMGSNKVTDLGAPTADADAATKLYVDTAVSGVSSDDKLPLAGGTMTGAIAMGANLITGVADPVAAQDAATKNYVDTVIAGAGVATDTDSLPEGSTNLYFTDTRARASLSGTAPINYNDTTGVIALDTVPVTSGGTGLTASTANAVMTTNASGAYQNTTCADGEILQFDAALGVKCATLPAGSTDKLPLAGGTMTGVIAMGGNAITGLSDPAAAQDASTKNYVDTADATKLDLAGGTMTGVIDMGANKISNLAAPTVDTDAATKLYVDTALAGAGTPSTTDDLTEGTTNLYFTDARARTSLSGTAPVNYDDTTGVIALDTVPVAKGGTGLTVSSANAVMTTSATGAYQNTTCANDEIIQFDTILGVKCGTLPTGATDNTKLPLAGGTMTGAILLADGTTAAPGLAFANDTDTGLRLASPGSVHFIQNGTIRMIWDGNDLTGNGGSGSWSLASGTGFLPNAPTYTFNGDNNTGFFSPGFDMAGITTAGVERLRVNATGNVGIGTTAPNAKLDVKGAIVMTGAVSGYSGFQPAATAGSTVWTLPMSDGTSGQVLSTDGSGVLSWTTASGGGGSGDFKADGSVPMTGNLQLDRFLTGGNTSNVIDSGTSAGNAFTIRTSDADIHLRTLNNNNILFTTNASEKMRLNTVGNLGIGTTAPNGKLDVKGSIVMSGSTSGYSGFRVPAAAGSTLWTLPAADGTSGQVLSTNGAGILSWATASGSSAWSTSGANVYRSSGNVGIGTTTPVFALDILSSADSQINLASSSATKGTSINAPADHYMRMGGAGAYDVQMLVVGSGFTSQPGRMVFRYGVGGSIWENTDGSTRTERMRITPAGNLGIGNTAPSEKLEVTGNVKATAFISTSDKRLKQNIQVAKGLPAILQLRGVSYEWKEDGSMDMGVIAQETEKVFPWAVVTDKVSGYKAVKYNSLVAPLIEAVKDLDKKDKEISRKIASIEEENQTLKKKNKELESMVMELAKRLDKIEAAQKKP